MPEKPSIIERLVINALKEPERYGQLIGELIATGAIAIGLLGLILIR